MKVRIRNNGKGWYVLCRNHNDESDVCFLNVGFKIGDAPSFEPNAEGKQVMDIDVISASHNSYRGKPNLFIFEWKDMQNLDENKEFLKQINGTPYANKFGKNVVDEDDLPF